MVPGVESLLVVINPDTGGSDEHMVQDAIDVLRAEADVQVQVCRTSMPGDLDGALHRRGGRTVVVAGGDRHVHTVVAALHRRNELDDTLLAILPDSSGGDFASGAGIPLDPAEAAEVVLGGVERRFDLITDCRGSVVVNGVRLGRCRHRIGARPWGPGRAVAFGGHGPMPAFERRPAKRRPIQVKPLHVRIEADDTIVTDFDRPVWSVAVNNAPSQAASSHVPAALGNREVSVPDADPADGLADVVVCFAVDSLSRVRNAFHRSAPGDGEDVLTLQARKVSIAGQRFWMSCDGQDSGTEQRCTWQVAPESLRMIVPETVPA